MNDLPLSVWLTGMGVGVVVAVGVAVYAAALGRVRVSEHLDSRDWSVYVLVSAVAVALWPIVVPCVLIYWMWRLAVGAVEWWIRRRLPS